MTATVDAPPPSPTGDAEVGPRVRAAVMWNGAAALVFRLANIGVTVIVARLLSPRDFGVFAVALTVHAVAMSVAELGVSSCLVRGDRPADEIAPTVATVSLVTSLVLATTMVIAAQQVAAALGAPEAASAVRVMAIAVALAGVIAVPSAQLSRDFRQDRIFLASVLAFVPATALLIVLAAHGGGALSFAWSRVAGQVIGAVVLFVSVDVRYLPGFTARVLRPLLHFGLPLAGANLLNFVLLNTDYALIGRWLGPVSLGIYVVAFNVASWATTLMSSMINGVAMPAFARAADDPLRARRYLHGATQAVAACALLLCAVSAGLASPLVETLYGDRWSGAAAPLALLAGYGALSVLCLVIANVVTAFGRTRLLFGLQVLWLGLLLPAMAIGVRAGGVTGAAAAHLVVIAAVVLPAYLAAAHRVVPGAVTTLARATRRPAAAAVVAAAVAAVASELPAPAPARLVLGGTCAVLAYVVVLAPLVVQVIERHGERVPLSRHVVRVLRRVVAPRRAMSVEATG